MHALFNAFAYNKVNMNETFNFVLGNFENIVGKGENASYQHFLLFPQCFPKITFSSISSKTQHCVVQG